MVPNIIEQSAKPLHPMEAQDTAERPPGRPRSFNRERVLDIALEMFLSRGYLSASVTELTHAMGISRPSLYAAFGSKEALFRQALELHARRHSALLNRALAEPTAREVVERLLREAVEYPTLAGGAGGFMGLLSSLPGDPDLQPVRDLIMTHHLTVMAALGARFSLAQEQGEISQALHPEGIAFLLEALTHGIAVRARYGTSAEICEDLVTETLAMFEKGSIAAARI